MDDDDDFLEVDIDQIVQGHTSRVSGQNGTEHGSSQVGRVDPQPVLMGPPSLPGGPGVLPLYSNIYQSNTNEPTLGTTGSMMLPYGGQPPRLPQQQQSQPGPGGSPFQRMNPASRIGATGNPHLVRQSNAAAATSSCSNSMTATPPNGGPAVMQPGAHIPALGSIYQHPQNPCTTSAGAQPLNKPRNLGQQLGFRAPGAGQGTQGVPYGGYGAFNNSHNTLQINSIGLREPAFAPASTAPTATTGPSATTSTIATVVTDPGARSSAVLAVPSNGVTLGPNPNLNHPSGSTRDGVAAAPLPIRPSYWPGAGAAGADPQPPAHTHGLGGYGCQISSGPGQPPPGFAGSIGNGAASGSGLYPGGGDCVGGSSGVAALHVQGHDMNALRAYNSALEAQVETLKRQLQESSKLAKSTQSLQEQLQHVQAEAQDLQRRHREASIRLQEERSKGEAAERERKEAQDKCLMLEAELHKARASGSATGAVRTPPPKKRMSPSSGSVNRLRQGPEPYAKSQCQPSQLQELQQQQELNNNELTGEVLRPGMAIHQHPIRGADGRTAAATPPPTHAAADGENATVTAASLASPLLLTALDGLLDARVPLWQRLWCACPDSLIVLLQPTATAEVAAAPAAADGHEGRPDLKATAAASAGPHHTSSQLNQPSQTGFTQAGCPSHSGNGDVDSGSSGGLSVRERCVLLVEEVRAQLRALSAGQGDGTAVMLELLELLQAATGHLGREDAVSSIDRGKRQGQGLGGGRSAASGEAGDDTQPHQEQDLLQARQQQELMQQRMALWPLVGPCVDLLAGLVVHSEACRAAVCTAMASNSDVTGLPSSSSPSLPGISEVAMAPASSTADTPLGPGGRCYRELHRGSLPYLLPARAEADRGGGGAAAAAVVAAAAARAERRRQLRSFIYGSSEDSHGAFHTGGSSAVDTARSLQLEDQQHYDKMPAPTSAAIQEVGGTGGGAATSRVACRAVCSPGKLVQLLMAVALCSHQYYDAAASITPAARSGGMAAAMSIAAPLDVLHCVAAALKAIGTMLPAASTREALLPVLLKPQHLLVPLLSRRATPSRLAAASLLHILLENPSCVATAATALGVPGYGISGRCRGPEPHGDRGQSSPHDKLLNPTAARQLFTAFLDGLELDDWGQECTAGRRRHGGDDNDVGSNCWGDGSSPYKLPRLILGLFAMLLETGHDAVIGALCCPSWLEGCGLPLRLLALADAACAPPGSKDTLEPVYPAPSNPAFKIVAKACVPSVEWLQRLRIAQEALILLKELLTGASKGRAALQDLASTFPDSDSQQFMELATSRLASWPRCPGELLQTAIGQECGLVVPELAPWAARIVLGGGGAGGGRAVGGATGCGAGAGRGYGGGIVVCSDAAIGALAASVRRRWQQWQLQQQQQPQ
ncbi:hypothetical protein Vretimale_1705 [Volvox reticuliferus]|uniref:Uncharacterized protein n=2 Tax=Volvox reticuliferus TaxID=1737510 RepID=A0A8J4D500_9CHLO|nr:hypothetical protein Vretimale_1705 [Volvox reticuliferus]